MGGIPKQTVLGEPLIDRPLQQGPLLRQPLAAPRLGRSVKGLRQHYNLIVETQSNVPFGWAEASYVCLPLVDILKLYAKCQQGSYLYEQSPHSLAIWTARRSRTALGQ